MDFCGPAGQVLRLESISAAQCKTVSSRQRVRLCIFLGFGNSIFKYFVFLFENSRMSKHGSLVYNIPRTCLTLNANAACENFTLVLFLYP